MIFKSPRQKPERKFDQRGSLYLHKRFQNRYVSLLTGSLLLSSTIFLAVAFYFTQQNYELFKSIAFDTQPEMVRHIERESQWLLILLGTSLIATGFCTYRISKRMTSHLIEPLVAMERNMRGLIVGKWDRTSFRISENQDFKDLSMTYEYLLHMLKSLTEQELELLMRMRLDPNEKETLHIWNDLINQKRGRLGMEPISATSLVTDVKLGQRRAS